MHVMCVADCEGETEEEGRATEECCSVESRGAAESPFQGFLPSSSVSL